ncbi:DUF982 domain-containing protein [Kaistia sp. MMO-174]|uniref:DUF982 domain-containing protein n=1 Tax=Kaistia sp. MMO-174 TaxID=3081256 RepID=UPI00301A9E2F
MNHKFAPVYIWNSDGKQLAVSDVLRVAKWLTELWPAEYRGTDRHIEAMEICLLELEGNATPDDVRALFVEAAFEADLLAVDLLA